MMHDPTECLNKNGWGGYYYHVGLTRPHDLYLSIVQPARSVNYAVRSDSYSSPLKEGILDMNDVIENINRGWRQVEFSSPDVFSVHHGIDNCRVLAPLFTGGPIYPRMLIVPVNPLIPPPYKVTPYWGIWWERVHNVMRPLDEDETDEVRLHAQWSQKDFSRFDAQTVEFFMCRFQNLIV